MKNHLKSEIATYRSLRRDGVNVKIWRELKAMQQVKNEAREHLRTYLADMEEPGGEGDCI